MRRLFVVLIFVFTLVFAVAEVKVDNIRAHNVQTLKSRINIFRSKIESEGYYVLTIKYFRTRHEVICTIVYASQEIEDISVLEEK